jgi:hypothetical protein
MEPLEECRPAKIPRLLPAKVTELAEHTFPMPGDVLRRIVTRHLPLWLVPILRLVCKAFNGALRVLVEEGRVAVRDPPGLWRRLCKDKTGCFSLELVQWLARRGPSLSEYSRRLRTPSLRDYSYPCLDDDRIESYKCGLDYVLERLLRSELHAEMHKFFSVHRFPQYCPISATAVKRALYRHGADGLQSQRSLEEIAVVLGLQPFRRALRQDPRAFVGTPDGEADFFQRLAAKLLERCGRQDLSWRVAERWEYERMQCKSDSFVVFSKESTIVHIAAKHAAWRRAFKYLSSFSPLALLDKNPTDRTLEWVADVVYWALRRGPEPRPHFDATGGQHPRPPPEEQVDTEEDDWRDPAARFGECWPHPVTARFIAKICFHRQDAATLARLLRVPVDSFDWTTLGREFLAMQDLDEFLLDLAVKRGLVVVRVNEGVYHARNAAAPFVPGRTEHIGCAVPRWALARLSALGAVHCV